MTRFRSLGVAAVLATILAGGAAFAQGPDDSRVGRRFGGPGFGRGAGLPLRELNLTDAQRQQVRTLMQQHQERLRTDIFALLTPEQQARVTQLEAERQQRRQQRQQQRQQN
jgi:Spy/CpxP family protein refolding chaperone